MLSGARSRVSVRMTAAPASQSGSSAASTRRSGGRAASRTVTDVMIPNRPSLPRTNRLRSGPAAEPGPGVMRNPPPGAISSSPATMSSIRP
jgi:hypothetical protein